MSLRVPLQAATMLSNGTQLTDTIMDGAEGRTTMAAELPVEDEAARRERSREYRRRYKQRQKEKDELLHAQVEATAMEVERLRLEQAALISQSHALSSLCTYSNSMIESLTAAAAASAAKARFLGGQAIEGVNTFRGWAKHEWIMLPTATELLMGSVWTPTDDHMRVVMKVSKPEEFVTNQMKFLDRLAQLLEEGKRSPEAKHHAELKINYLLSIWVRFTILCANERREMMEEIVCTYQLKSLRDQFASGQYVRPHMLQFSPAELASCVELSYEQKIALESHWKKFINDIKEAASTLEEYTSKVFDGVEAVMQTGVYKPASTSHAAECFLLATDAANASDEFLAKEGRAFMDLWISAIQVLTPVQIAVVLTSCRPLVPHIPEVCTMLLSNQPAVEGQGFSITDVNDAE
ncbi:hypothetical protein Ndes2526B_g00169 [Nannochloris sp. 'desiccata']